MKKKINLNRAKISSEEIAKRKDFDSVLKGQAGSSAVSKALLQNPWFLSGVVGVIVAIVATVWMLDKSPAPQSEQQDVSDNIALEKFYAEEEAKPCINPPLKELNMPYTSFNVIAEKGAMLDFKTGTKISIPENAFSDKNGKIIKGNVELRYREFHDAVDFFLAGIPMTYDSAGVRYHFESAGMIQIEGYQDGKKLNIAEGKKIDISMASDYAGNHYNLYELDTLKNNWACLGKDKIVAPKTTKTMFVGDTVSRKNIKDSPEFKKIETQRIVIEQEIEKKIAALPELQPAPSKPNRSNKDRYTFDLDVDTVDYPELGVYSGVLFEVGDETKNFTKDLYKVVWDNAIIKQGPEKGKNYRIFFEKGRKTVEVIAYPVFGGKNYEKALKDYNEKFNKYTVLQERRKEEEKKVEAMYFAKLAALKKEQEALEQKWKRDENEAFGKMNNEEKVIRFFQVSNFGIYNCDTPNNYPSGIMCRATLESSGRALKLYNCYHIDLSRNAIFSYTRNPLNSFSFNPKTKNVLWAVESGVLFYLQSNDFGRIKDGENQKLKMTRLEQKFTSSEEMKTFFNL